jgi:adenylate cyclase
MLDASRKTFKAQIEAHQGRVIDMAGDSVLAAFDTAAGAVLAAIAIQSEVNAVADSASDDRRMRFRIGVHLGDVFEKTDGTVYGDGVNIAARLEGLAQPGGITVSEAVHGAVRGKLNARFIDQGAQQVKNIEHPVRAYQLLGVGAEPANAPTAPLRVLHANHSNVVLAFDNMTGDPAQECFCDGISGDIITDLSKINGLAVIGRQSAFAYKGKANDLRTVGRELGVRYVLEGSVRLAANRVRVNAQLIEADTGTHVWAKRYDRELKDVFLVGDEITEDIVSSLDVKLGRGEEADMRAANRCRLRRIGRSSREFPAMHQYGVSGSIFRNWRDVRAPWVARRICLVAPRVFRPGVRTVDL